MHGDTGLDAGAHFHHVFLAPQRKNKVGAALTKKLTAAHFCRLQFKKHICILKGDELFISPTVLFWDGNFNWFEIRQTGKYYFRLWTQFYFKTKG